MVVGPSSTGSESRCDLLARHRTEITHMTGRLLRRSFAATVVTGTILATAPLLGGTAYAAAPAVKSHAPGDPSTATRPRVSATYDQSLDTSASTLSLTDNADSGGTNLCGSLTFSKNSVDNDTIACDVQSDLVDGHKYTIHAHAVN